MDKRFVAIQCKMVQYFVKCLWGCKFMHYIPVAVFVNYTCKSTNIDQWWWFHSTHIIKLITLFKCTLPVSHLNSIAIQLFNHFIMFAGNQAILEDIHSNIDFSYVRILKMMYSMDPDVRLLAGLALATFAYNNVNQQKEIADQGGVRFNCFCPFLQSADEYYRCLSAFQVRRQMETVDYIGDNF